MNNSGAGPIPKKLVHPISDRTNVQPYLEVVQSFIAVITDISERLDEVSGALNVMATYLERKGVEEGVFSPEDLKAMRGEDEESDEPEPV